MNDRQHLLRTALGALFLATVLSAAPAAALENLGLAVGLDRTVLSGDEPANFRYQTKSGFQGTAVVEFGLGRDVLLSLQPGYRHTEVGVGYKDRLSGVVRDSVSIKADWLVLPVMLRIGGAGAFFASGGFDLAVAVGGGLEGGESGEAIEDLVRDLDVAALVGVGVELPAGRFRFLGELRYRQGLLNAARNSDPDNEALSTRFRFSGWLLQVGLLLPMGEP